MKCPKCKSSDYKIMVQCSITAPAGMYGNFTKKNLRKKEVYFNGVMWETVDFICDKCNYVELGYGNYVTNMRKTLEWYAANHRPEDYLEDNGERAQKALDFNKNGPN